MPRGQRTANRQARLQEALVLHKYILSLLGCRDLTALSADSLIDDFADLLKVV